MPRGPGALSTASALCGVARAAGARVLVVTAEPEGATAAMADDLLVIPAQTMARDVGGASVLPMGSLFEGAMFLVFEVLVLRLREALGETPGDDARPAHEHGVSEVRRGTVRRPYPRWLSPWWLPRPCPG